MKNFDFFKFSGLNVYYSADKAILNRNLSVAAHLRSQIFALERGLTEQKIKCRALEEELQNPVNIHRWRKLEVAYLLFIFDDFTLNSSDN